MFEYYKWKLSNKPIGKQEPPTKDQAPLGIKIWAISLLLASLLSTFVIFAPSGGTLTLSILLLNIALTFGWLVTQLKDEPIKKITIKLIQFTGILLIATLLLGLIFGGIAVLAHNIMENTHHLGQIATTIDLLTRGIILLLTPILIVTLFRFIENRPTLTKIRRKLYLELLIIVALGLLISQIPNAVVLRSLLLTQLMQFLIFTIINTLIITAVITTCKNRGVLT